MKTRMYYLISLVIGISMISCDPHEKLIPSEQVEIWIHNQTIDTLNFFFHATNGYPMKLDSVPPNTVRSFFILGYWDNSIRDDVFLSIFTHKKQNKQLIVTSLLGDTLAQWDDSSTVFTDRNYWKIESNKKGGSDMEFKCTLNLTDEVLKLK